MHVPEQRLIAAAEHLALLCRLEWDALMAARNVLRLHAASLPALACALLLLRLALLFWGSDRSHRTTLQMPRLSQGTAHIKSCQQQPSTAGRQQLLYKRSASSKSSVITTRTLCLVIITWAIIASWLWPQLATRAGWMSHRRPSLPSVMWCAVLLLLTDGLLEALEGMATAFNWCCKQLPQWGSSSTLLARQYVRMQAPQQLDYFCHPGSNVTTSTSKVYRQQASWQRYKAVTVYKTAYKCHYACCSMCPVPMHMFASMH